MTLLIEKPEFDGTGLTYCMKWPRLGIAAKIDHPYDSKDSVSAEITFTFADGGHIKRSRVNLTSDRSQESFAKSAIRQYPGPVVNESIQPFDWHAIVEQVCKKSLDAYRLGSPLQAVQDFDYKPLSFLVHPLLPERQVSALYGPPGAIKSTLAALICLKVAYGLSGPGLNGSLATQQGPVLWLDYETDFDTFKWVLGRLAKGLGIEKYPDNIFYQPLDRPLTACLEMVQDRVNTIKPKLIVLDSVLRAIGQVNANETGPASGLANAIRTLNTTTLEIAHGQKGEGEKSMLGSQLFTASVRWAWEAQVSESSEESESHLALHHTKHNLSRKLPPIGLSFTYDGDDGPISVAR
ncbi:MAG: AAA family ATPase, partial [Dehalococcoidia bacterium]|nr:AAA family ATPase [Dehalococcoidia bacterium]